MSQARTTTKEASTYNRTLVVASTVNGMMASTVVPFWLPGVSAPTGNGAPAM